MFVLVKYSVSVKVMLKKPTNAFKKYLMWIQETKQSVETNQHSKKETIILEHSIFDIGKKALTCGFLQHIFCIYLDVMLDSFWLINHSYLYYVETSNVV